MSALLLDLCLLMAGGCCCGTSTPLPLSTSQEVMEVCDRLPWEECALSTDLLLNMNLGEIKTALICDEFPSKMILLTRNQIVDHQRRRGRNFSGRWWSFAFTKNPN